MKFLYAFVLAVSGFLNMAPVFAADTTSNVITLSVTIVAPTCSVNDNQRDQTINLGTWATSHFGNKGDVTSSVPFSIALTGCPTYGNLTTVFTGTGDEADSGLLALSSDSTAKNIAIAILNADGSALALNEKSHAVSLDSTGNAELSYLSRYVSTGNGVTAGTANGVATFIIYYE